MGKRELLLIGAFLLLGVGVYHLTAPPPKPGEQGFSLGRLIGWVRTEIQGENAEARVTRTLLQTVDHEVTRIVLPEFNGTLRVIGEDREDVSAELKAVAFGLDDTTASVRAQQITLTLDDRAPEAAEAPPAPPARPPPPERPEHLERLERPGAPSPPPPPPPAPPEPPDEPRGKQLTLRVRRPDMSGRRPTFELTLRVPARLTCTLGFRGEGEVRGVREVRFLGARGKVVIRDVGSVTGEFGNGSLEVLSARAVDLKTQRTEVRLERVTGPTELDAERGWVRLRHLMGPVKLRFQRVECEAEAIGGTATITSEGGRIKVRGIEAPVEITADRTGLELTMTKAVTLTASTKGDEIAFDLPRDGLMLEARVEEGRIRVSDDRLMVKESERNQQLNATIGSGGPLVRLRNEHADIVIRGAVENATTTAPE